MSMPNRSSFNGALIRQMIKRNNWHRNWVCLTYARGNYDQLSKTIDRILTDDYLINEF
jgi:hypothetical protein